MFWTVVVGVVAVLVIVIWILSVWATLDEKRRKAAADARNQRILEANRIDRQNRDFIAGHTAGLYGDYIPVDLETGQPLEVTRRDRPRLSSDDFKHQFKRNN